MVSHPIDRSLERTDSFRAYTHHNTTAYVPAHKFAKVGVALHAGHVQGTGAAAPGGGRSRDGRQEGMGGREEGEGQEQGLTHHG